MSPMYALGLGRGRGGDMGGGRIVDAGLGGELLVAVAEVGAMV